MKPIIGITTFNESKPRKDYNSVSRNYIRSIQLAGGLPVLIPVANIEEDLLQYVKQIDGILFTGGEDISPLYYGENPIKELTLTSSERDEYELKLFKKAYDSSLPILGICRGIQLINVALGGTLYQDINAQLTGSLGHLPAENPVNELYHTIDLNKKSKLYEIFREGRLKVNSFHHQAVKDLGNGLTVSALSSDGIIEGVEAVEKDYLIGVQWHPEDLTLRYPLFIKLFESFVKACASR